MPMHMSMLRLMAMLSYGPMSISFDNTSIPQAIQASHKQVRTQNLTLFVPPASPVRLVHSPAADIPHEPAHSPAVDIAHEPAGSQIVNTPMFNRHSIASSCDSIDQTSVDDHDSESPLSIKIVECSGYIPSIKSKGGDCHTFSMKRSG